MKEGIRKQWDRFWEWSGNRIIDRMVGKSALAYIRKSGHQVEFITYCFVYDIPATKKAMMKAAEGYIQMKGLQEDWFDWFDGITPELKAESAVQ